MAQIAKQVVASQNFLEGLLSLPHYAELRLKQLERLLALISKASLTLEQSGPIISSLDSRIWDGLSLQRLKSALADKTLEVSDAAETEGRVKQQDYTSLPRYLTEEWWLLLEKAESQESKEKALEHVCDLAGKLGLRNGTEETYAFLFLLAFTMHPASLVYDSEKQSLLQKWKPLMKRYLKKHAPLTSVLSILPEKVEECPGMYLRAAFPDGFKAAAPKCKSLTDVFRLGRTWPLRISNVAVAAGKATQPSRDLSQFTASAMGVAAAVARQTSLALSQHLLPARTESLSVEGLQEVEKIDKVMSVPPLALMDKPPESVAANSKSKPKESDVDPQSMIDSLREDLQAEKQQDQKEKKKTGTKKEKTQKGKKPIKKPAAASKVLKRPSSMSSAAAAMQPLDPDPERAALLSRIPAHVRSKYVHGCSRCYHRKFCTISCWKRRGYT